MKYLIVLVLLTVYIMACSKPTLHKKLFDGEIVYIRANSAKTGLEAGTFGDVFICDGRGKTKRITHDYVYDAEPNWMDNGEKILFASRRGNDGMGMGRSSYLIVFNLKTKKFHNLNSKVRKLNTGYRDVGFNSPSVDFSGKDILFYFLNSDYKNYIALYVVHRNKIIDINIDSLGMKNSPSDLRLSPNGKNVIFYNYVTDNISLLNFKDHSLRNLHKGTDSKNYEIGSWINNSQFSFSVNKDSVSTIKSYDINTDSVKTLAVIHSGYVDDPVVSLRQKKIIYIVSNNYNNGDIWVYNMRTRKSDKLTNDGHAIQDIDWCQSCSYIK